MTQVSLVGAPIVYPWGYWPGVITGAAVSAVSVGSNVAHKAAMIIRCPKAGTLDKFEYYCPSQTGTNTVRQSFQDVDLTTGAPDGGVDQFRNDANPSSGAWFAPGLITSDGTNTGTKRTVSAGDYLACVVDYTAYTNGSSQIRVLNALANTAFPYHATNTGAWAKAVNYPVLALKYNDGSYGYFAEPIFPISALSTANTATNAEQILRFIVPFACTISGCRIWGDFDGAATTINLYSSDGTTIMSSVTYDTDARQATGGSPTFFYFGTPQSLTANSTYYIGVYEATSGNSAIQYADMGVMAASPGGAEWYYGTRATPGSGSISTTTTRRPFIDIVITKIDDGTGATGFAGTSFARVFSGM